MTREEFLREISPKVEEFVQKHGRQLFPNAWLELNEVEKKFQAAIGHHDGAIIHVQRKDQHDPAFMELVVAVATTTPVSVIIEQ